MAARLEIVPKKASQTIITLSILYTIMTMKLLKNFMHLHQTKVMVELLIIVTPSRRPVTAVHPNSNGMRIWSTNTSSFTK